MIFKVFCKASTSSKSVAFGCGGSSPPTGTNMKALIVDQGFFCSLNAMFLKCHSRAINKTIRNKIIYESPQKNQRRLRKAYETSQPKGESKKRKA